VRVFKGLFSLFILALASSQVQAATYYVAKSGNDSASGAQTAPWLTISHAVTKAAAGDTVSIAAGSYTETVKVTGSGSSAARVTYQGSGQPVLVGNLTITGSYVTFAGFTVSPTSAGGYAAIDVEGTNNKLSSVTVTKYGATASDQATAIMTGGSFNTIDSCSVLNLNDIDVFHIWGHDITVSNCVVTNIQEVNYNLNHTDFVQSWGLDSGQIAYNILFIGNLVTNSDCQCGNTETDGNSGLHDWTFANNIFVNIGDCFFSGIPNTNFYNNIFDNVGSNQGYAISLYTQTNYSSVGDKFANNVFINNQQDINLNTTSSSQVALCTNNYFAAASNAAVKNGEYMGSNFVNGGDPKFVSPPSDFHIQTGSVLIGAGISVASFNVDKDGVLRSSWAIGPYQPTSTSVPAAPANLRIN
jgi:hypothetical protein